MALRKPRLSEPVPFPGRGLTAATAQVDLSQGSSWRTWKFGNKDWQNESWRLYDIVPEHRFLANRTGDSVAKARLYVTEVDDRGEPTGETKDEAIARLAAIPLGTGAERDGSLRLAGVDLAAAGECWIVGENAASAPEQAEGSWFVVTGSALKREGDLVKVKKPKNKGGSWLTLTDGQDILIRSWREHPNDTDQADSYARSAIVPLREIELLTKREFAELDSRLTGAGVWLLPEGVDYPREANDPEGIAGFMAYVQRAAAASMRDQTTANAMVPIMATVPDSIDMASLKEGLINFWSPLSAEIGDMKDRAVARVANSAEIPSEVLTGIGDANHWTAWLISDEGIRWIGGYLGLIADALTRGFLQLAIPRVAPGADPKRYAFAFDTSDLAAKPNRLDDALKLRELNLISDVETVRAGAFSEDQMPTEKERVVQILLQVVKTQPDLLLDPVIQQVLGLPAITQIGLPATADQNADGQPGNTPDQGEIEQGPPNDGDPEEPDEAAGRAEILAALDRRLALASAPPPPPTRETVFNAACKLIVYRALELAGGRLTTPQERVGRWKEIPRHELHHVVGPITPDKAMSVTAEAWKYIPITAADLGVDEEGLRYLLQTYVTELLTRGLRHHDDMLYAALGMANQGKGLVAA